MVICTMTGQTCSTILSTVSIYTWACVRVYQIITSTMKARVAGTFIYICNSRGNNTNYISNWPMVSYVNFIWFRIYVHPNQLQSGWL